MLHRLKIALCPSQHGSFWHVLYICAVAGSNEGETTMMTLQHQSNRAIIRTLHQLCKDERAATAELLIYLAEVDRRKLYADQGYSSMFAFCQDALHIAISQTM